MYNKILDIYLSVKYNISPNKVVISERTTAYPYLPEFKHLFAQLVENGVIWCINSRFALQQGNLLLLLFLFLDCFERVRAVESQ